MKKNLRLLFICILTFLGYTTARAESTAVKDEKARTYVFIRPDPGNPPHPFFDEFESAMRAATQSLGDKLEVRYANTDHYRMLEQITEAANTQPKPDAIVFMAMRSNGEQALTILEKAGVHGFIINAGLTDEQYQKAGAPRSHFKYWLGEMLPDDVAAGKILAQNLYEKAIAANPSLKETGVKMLAIEANPGDGASILRTQGLQEYAAQQPNLEILQIVRGQWEQEKAKELTAHMLKRYERIDVIWAASDAMAVGGAQAAIEHGLSPAKNVFIGGVDWSQQGFEEIVKSTLSASAGGHILEGAWAAIVLHDYFNGHDFEGQEGLRMKSPMYIADHGNLNEIRGKMGARNWDKMDFKSFSKAYNPEIKAYNFSILATPQ